MSRTWSLIWVCCAGLSLQASARAEEQAVGASDALTQWVVETAHVHYTVFHPLHNVEGMSRQVEGFVRFDAEGMHLSVLSAVTSFFSSDMSRDARIAELLDAAHYPAVTIKAFVPHFVLATRRGAQDVPLTVAITLHGVGSDVSTVAHVTRIAAESMRVHFELVDSITAHGLTRPRYWLWPVNDNMRIQGEIDLVAKPILEVQPKDEYSE